MANLIDSLVSYVSPQAALRRAQARRALAYYEAARPSTQRKQRRSTGSGSADVIRAGKGPREQARYLEENHDLARGILGTLVQNMIGPNGIGIEPQPRRIDGSIAEDFAAELLNFYLDFCKKPEVTWRHDMPSMQRILARSWVRDGDVFVQHLLGTSPTLDHGTIVPYSVEMIEADLVPIDYHSETPLIRAGVALNTWNRPTGVWVYKHHPGDYRRATTMSDLKFLPAASVSQLALIDRINQVRGMTVFASVLGRLDDLKDYEESERIAAKVAASMAAVIIKGSPDVYPHDASENGEPEPRDLRFRPGMIFDDLEPGESISTIDTSRPSAQLEPHRKGQQRAIAAGTMTSYSSTAKDYNGTYSAQRQELVEQYGAYGILSAEFVSQMLRPVYERFVNAALLSGELVMPRDLDSRTLTDALYIAPQMPWIDPLKEATAWTMLEAANYASGPEIIRRRGLNPADVLEQEALWRKKLSDRELSSSIEMDVADNENETTGGTNARIRFRR